MEENHNLLTLYNYLNQHVIPCDCHFLHLVSNYYQSYKAFYRALEFVKQKNIEEILYDSSNHEGLNLIISLKNEKVDKFIQKFTEGFVYNLDDNEFSMEIKAISENSINVLIKEQIKESDYYELRFTKYRRHYKSQQLETCNQSNFI